ncbi:CaiB/BaiF CoA transferase family protein [Tianweitania sediminis]|uniref:CoA transferase n=1 Tax=Tianweitania sediminis TaxID=1502156 RepID=A0A8J7R316_9HYPH|nr:CoA transferase [Tianweitania sediminis]MBP0439978.1 CoA transferase [Tianweitania sediminis]
MSLTGTRVVDFTRIISGPFCTQLLADLGADVIKIETAAGDPLREQGKKVEGLSWYYAGYNRNKRSIAIDLRHPDGHEILADMIASSDVVVENFRPGVMAAMGFSDERLRKLNPRLVVCHISGFGSSGPYSHRPAFDFIAQALSGFMSVNGNADDLPLRSGLPVSDLVAGLYGALGVTAALAGLREDRAFRSLDISLTDGLVSLLSYMAADTLATGEPPQRSGNDHPLVAPYGLFRTADKPIAIAPSNDAIYARLLNAIGRDDLATDPRFDTNEKRMADREAIRLEIEPVLMTASAEEWIERLNEGGVPAGPVLTIPEMFDDPQIRHREMVLPVPHGPHGTVRMLGFPIKSTPGSCEMRRPAPALGQHGDEVLGELGYDRDRIDTLRAKGALR